MKVSIFGTGYVGLVTGACLAEAGHHVLCMDVDEEKISDLKEGVIPIYEPGLESIVVENLNLETLSFTSNAQDAVDFSEINIIAVGTPPDEDGSADVSYVLGVATSIGKLMQTDKLVVTKSTVPVGTSDKVKNAVLTELRSRGVDLKVRVVSNPEFLKEGAAVNDFRKPDRIVIGTNSEKAKKHLLELYAPYNRNHDRMVFMDIRSAELTKYAANAMLATKISFINEIANLAEKLGADIENVRQGIGSDPRIGYQFIYPGCGYGGSCFPKDVRALSQTAAQHGVSTPLMDAVETVNTNQKSRLPELVLRHYNNDIKGKVFALWGLAFKPKTNDMREAPSLSVMQGIWDAGGTIQAFDPEAMSEVERIYGARPDLKLVGTKSAALFGADALIICTEWQHFRAPDFDEFKNQLADAVVFDGRNLYDPDKIKQQGITYYAIGRGASSAKTKPVNSRSSLSL